VRGRSMKGTRVSVHVYRRVRYT